MNTKDMTIAVLSTTSVVLLVGILVVNMLPSQALGAGMTAKAGKYVVTVGVGSTDNEEYLYIMDTSSERVGVYRFVGNRIQLSAGMDLAPLAKKSSRQPGKRKPAGRS